MEANKKVLIGVGSAAAAVGGFVAFRLYVRSETKKTLTEEYRFDEVFEFFDNIGEAYLLSTGKSLNLPTYDEFVVALVPVWGVTMPKAAIADVLKNGRESVFWSDAHRKPVNRAVESQIFRAMRAAYETPEDATLTEMLAAATLAVVQNLLTQKGK